MEEKRRLPRTIVLALVLTLPTLAHAKTLYVDANAPGLNDGSSWSNAYRYLQDALADAEAAEKPVEIRVAQGVYRPDRSSAHPEGTRDRKASFCLLDEVALKGGFAGLGASDPNARDIARYESVLSGDLAGDDVPVADPCNLVTEPTRTENSYTIVTASPCGRSAVLDGFTITEPMRRLRAATRMVPCPCLRTPVRPSGIAASSAMSHFLVERFVCFHRHSLS